jgi:leucyl aminopeptidase
MTKLHNTNNLGATRIQFHNPNTLSQNTNKEYLRVLSFGGKYKEIVYLIEQNIVFLGTQLQEKKTWDPYYKVDFFELGSIVGNFIKTTKIKDIQLDTTCLDITSKEVLDFSLGFGLSVWKFDKYQKPANPEDSISYRIFNSKQFANQVDENLIKYFSALQKGIAFTRNLVDDTPEQINPTSMQEIIQSNFGQYQNLTIKNIDEDQLENMGMNCILSVGRASKHKPFLSHIVYKPNSQPNKKICLVGKGVTYDSGGLNIKVGEYMKTMKCDMAGAATILGVLNCILDVGLKNTELHIINPFVENMIGSNAYKADDVITSYSGQTVEVHNTDAEGRLILADALAFATTQNPDYIIDLATLTGACISAISEYYTAIMGNDYDLVHNLNKNFEKNLEYAQITHLPTVLNSYLKSSIGDISNISSLKQAGHSTAGIFLSNFVNQSQFREPFENLANPKNFPWVHLDIAGSSYNQGKNKLFHKGSTGAGVRSIVSWLLEIDK